MALLFMTTKQKHFEHGFQRGDVLTIEGKVKDVSNPSFSVNFCNSDSLNQILFHFNPRLYSTWFWGPRLVMNAFEKGKWGYEENVTPCPFSKTEKFTLTIKNGDKGFEVDMSNGFRYNFIHRTQSSVNYVKVCGDVELDKN